MLAFLGPVQILVLMMVLLLVFGPDRLPEMGKQFGKALREIMKAKQEFMNSINFDEEPKRDYAPPQYDDYQYNNDYANQYSSGDESWKREEGGWQASIAAEEPARGDFLSSAFADNAEQYAEAPSLAPSPAQPSAASGEHTSNMNFAPPSGTVAREG